VPPKVVNERRDVGIEIRYVGIGDPREHVLSIVVGSLVEMTGVQR
jgi:hypothetical protein